MFVRLGANSAYTDFLVSTSRHRAAVGRPLGKANTDPCSVTAGEREANGANKFYTYALCSIVVCSGRHHVNRRNSFPVSLEGLLVTKSNHLSLRELQVLLLAAHGQTAKASALALHISESAIGLYMTHARYKLGAKTKTEAIAMFMDTGAVFTESIESVVSKTHDDRCIASDQLHEMQRVSNKLRHLVDGMLLADATDKIQHTDLAVWKEIAEGLLRTAAHTFGYEIVKVRVAEAAINSDDPSQPEVAGNSPKTLE